jgi:hypothetical protein
MLLRITGICPCGCRRRWNRASNFRKTIIQIAKATRIHHHYKIINEMGSNFDNVTRLPSTGMTQLKIRIERIREVQRVFSTAVA